uniref:Uncharacterized protein n=1 Tax=Tanacetum cinerariifolium TaxID=118510 RepID=A0A6L2NF12_TANCI|nr:hypothetical protein [Tanacetum cinerariifolium]
MANKPNEVRAAILRQLRTEQEKELQLVNNLLGEMTCYPFQKLSRAEEETRKFETPPDSPPVTVVDPDDQPMWSSTRTIAQTPSSVIVQLPISNNFFIKDNPTQGILDAGAIFLYNTPNEAFKLLDDKEMIREWMARQTEANERIKNQKILRTESLPRTTNYKLRHEFVYKTPSIQNENDKGDVKAIEADKIEPISTMPNPNLIKSNSPTVTTFLKHSTVHIHYTNAKTFADDVSMNNVGDKEFKSFDGIGTGRMTKKEKNKKGMTKEPNKEWKLDEKAAPDNENVYHYLWHPTKIPHLNRIIKES